MSRHIAVCLQRLSPLLLGFSLLFAMPALASSLVVGKPAPPLALVALDGSHLDTRTMQGQVVVITFLATWCSACQQELPLLSTYAAEHAGEGLRVIGVSLDTPDQLEALKAMVKPLSFPVGLLGSDRVSGYGRIWRLPVSFTIDRQGRLVDNGWDDADPAWTRERLEHIVTPLLTAAHQTPGRE